MIIAFKLIYQNWSCCQNRKQKTFNLLDKIIISYGKKDIFFSFKKISLIFVLEKIANKGVSTVLVFKFTFDPFPVTALLIVSREKD